MPVQMHRMGHSGLVLHDDFDALVFTNRENRIMHGRLAVEAPEIIRAAARQGQNFRPRHRLGWQHRNGPQLHLLRQIHFRRHLALARKPGNFCALGCEINAGPCPQSFGPEKNGPCPAALGKLHADIRPLRDGQGKHRALEGKDRIAVNRDEFALKRPQVNPHVAGG